MRQRHGRRKPACPTRHGRAATALTLAFLAIAAQGVRAQTASEPTRTYSVAFVGIPLSEALTRLIDETQISIAYESEAVRGPVTFCKVSDVEADALLRCVLKGTGLDFIRLSSGTYVIVEDLRVAAGVGTLQGRILDADTKSPLADANVLVLGEGFGAATNADGRFAIADLPAGRHRLVVTHVAYQAADRVVSISSAHRSTLHIELEPRVLSTSPIVVKGFESRLPLPSLGVASPRTEEHLVAGVGTQDVIQDLGAVAGVQVGTGMSDVHVQGGDTNEQQFRLDGVPIFLPIANAGFFGPFSPQSIGNITVRKAGFEASQGSGLSGVVDLTHRVSAERISGVVQVDPMSLNARLSGRSRLGGQTNVSWMVGSRTSLWDAWGSNRLVTLFSDWGAPDQFLLDELGVMPGDSVITIPASRDVNLDFTSIHAATRFQFGGFRSLSLSYFQGNNAFGIEDVSLGGGEAATTFTDRYEWLNRAGQIRYEWVASSRAFVSTSAWVTTYNLSHPTIASQRSSSFVEDFNEIRQVGARADLFVAAASRHYVSTSVEFANTVSSFSFSLDPLGENAVDATAAQPARAMLAGHLEDRISLSEASTLTVGGRLSYLPARGRVFAEPRLEFRTDRSFGRGRTAAFRLAVGRYRQYLNSFDVTTSGVSTLLPVIRYWLPVGKNDQIPEAYHVAAGVIYRPDTHWETEFESYYKRQSHVLVPDYDRNSPVEAILVDAKGYSYGFAASVTRKTNSSRVEARYEFGNSRRRVPGRFENEYMSVPWEAPHRVSFAAYVSLLRNVDASIRWHGLYGRTWAYRQSYYDYLEPNPDSRQFGSVDLSHPEEHHLPVFSQVDVGLGLTAKPGGLTVEFRASVANVLGRDNANDWSLVAGNGGATFGHVPRLSTPFLPSISVSVSW